MVRSVFLLNFNKYHCPYLLHLSKETAFGKDVGVHSNELGQCRCEIILYGSVGRAQTHHSLHWTENNSRLKSNHRLLLDYEVGVCARGDVVRCDKNHTQRQSMRVSHSNHNRNPNHPNPNFEQASFTYTSLLDFDFHDVVGRGRCVRRRTPSLAFDGGCHAAEARSNTYQGQ